MMIIHVGFEVFTAVVMKSRVLLNGLHGVISQKMIFSDDNSIQFFIYLRAELNSQWPITESARI
jgi:hypothetical protein